MLFRSKRYRYRLNSEFGAGNDVIRVDTAVVLSKMDTTIVVSKVTACAQGENTVSTTHLMAQKQDRVAHKHSFSHLHI